MQLVSRVVLSEICSWLPILLLEHWYHGTITIIVRFGIHCHVLDQLLEVLVIDSHFPYHLYKGNVG